MWEVNMDTIINITVYNSVYIWVYLLNANLCT